MTTPLDKLRDERQYVIDHLQALSTDGLTRDLSPDEDAAFQAGLDYVADADKRIDRFVATIDQAKADTNIERGATFGAPNVIVRQDPFDLSELRTSDGSQTRSQACRAIEAGAFAKDAHRERAEELVRTLPVDAAVRVLATASPTYERAFGKLIQDPSGISLTHDEREVFTRAASLTTTAGGFAVPVIIDPTLILTSDGSANPFRQISRVVPITNDKWKGVSTAGVTAAFSAEGSAITEGSPTLAQPTITAHRAHAQINYSFEIGMDYPGFTSDMLLLLQDAKDTLEATKHAVGAGDGSNEPVGIVTALAGTASEINVAGAEGVFAATDLYAVEEALGPRFRPNASWVANKSIYNRIRQFDANGGAALWERLGAAMPSQLLGYNAYEASAMDGSWDVSATATNYIAILGDFRNYVIVDRVGMSVETVQHVVNGDGKLTGQRGLLAWWRTGADSVNDAAFTILDNPTAA
jgi:HK97 family phage major capsid protein